MGNQTNLHSSAIAPSSTIMITGASSGLGKELAIKLSKFPVQLLLAGRDSARLNETKFICESFNKAEITTFQGDLSNMDICKKLVQFAMQKFNKIDVLVLNAGINAHFSFSELQNMQIFQKLMKVNLYANVYLTKFALQPLRQSKGHIVVISSMSGKLGMPDRSAYCSSKFALTGFFESLRIQQPTITISIVYPTSLDTPMRNNDVLQAKMGTEKGHGSKNKQESAEKAAQMIVEEVMKTEKGKGGRDLFVPWKMWMGTALQPLFPNFIRQKVKLAAKL